MFKKVVLGIAVCYGVIGGMCENSQGITRVEGINQLPALPADMMRVRGVSVHNCEVTQEFVCKCFEGFNRRICASGTFPDELDFSRCKMTDDVRECIMSWLRDFSQFGCVFLRLNFKECGFSEEQRNEILEDLRIADSVVF